MEGYFAVDILRAAIETFLSCNTDKNYAFNKATNFINRCGNAQPVYNERTFRKETIDKIVFAMLDEDSGKIFWNALEEFSNENTD